MIGASLVEIEDLHNSARKQTAARPSFGGSSGTPQGRLAYGGVVPGCSNFTVNEGQSGASPGILGAGPVLMTVSTITPTTM